VAGLAVAVAVVTASCSAGTTAAGPAPTPPGASGPTSGPPATGAPRPASPRAPEANAPDLSAAVAKAAGLAGDADLAVAVLDLETGARAGHRADLPFRTASLSKLVVAVDMLADGHVDDEDRDRLRRALGASDDEAMNALWTAHDGYGAVGRVADLVGLTATRAPADASQWGDVEMSADDVVRLYRHVLTGLPEAERNFVVESLSAAPGTAADGFDQAFGLLAPGLDAYAKQGWMWYLPADLHLHSAGVVADRYAVALLSVQGAASTGHARDLLTDVARGLVPALAPRS